MTGDLLADFFTAIAERGRGLLAWPNAGREWPGRSLPDLCEALLAGKGEVTGLSSGAAILARYKTMGRPEKLAFFGVLARDFGPDRSRLSRAVDAWLQQADADTSAELHFSTEPRRQELFRRLNRAASGTAALVEMRADLLGMLDENPELACVDRDFVHLLSSWFNPGFLVLRRIDWATSASVLEKIIRYEAVHEIEGWDDLRRRIEPADRRCYAFFHPALLDEPIIFVEVALLDEAPDAIAPLLASERSVVPIDRARVAAFYSISNCQKGLIGISFGNFLIKRVVEEMRRELRNLGRFVTLSPVPGFRAWVAREGVKLLPRADEELGKQLLDDQSPVDPAAVEANRDALERLAAHYFVRARTGTGRVVDPVARFHLGNGAHLDRINVLGDSSPKAMREALGLMVNYCYEPDAIERNHEAFATDNVVKHSKAIAGQLRRSEKLGRIVTRAAQQG